MIFFDLDTKIFSMNGKNLKNMGKKFLKKHFFSNLLNLNNEIALIGDCKRPPNINRRNRSSRIIIGSTPREPIFHNFLSFPNDLNNKRVTNFNRNWRRKNFL